MKHDQVKPLPTHMPSITAPHIHPGDRVSPIKPESLWSHPDYHLIVLEVFPSRTRPGFYSVRLEVDHGRFGKFKTVQPAEDFQLWAIMPET